MSLYATHPLFFSQLLAFCHCTFVQGSHVFTLGLARLLSLRQDFRFNFTGFSRSWPPLAKLTLPAPPRGTFEIQWPHKQRLQLSGFLADKARLVSNA